MTAPGTAGWLQSWSGDDLVIVPLDDEIVHDFHGRFGCLCNPEVKMYGESGTMVFVHEALDGRR